MKSKFLLVIWVLMLVSAPLDAQVHSPIINIKFSKLFATFEFVKNLSDSYPENKYKEIYRASEFNREPYNSLLAQFDMLNTYESYHFQDYPVGQKIPGNTDAILTKNLISSETIQEFKESSFGIIPSSDLLAFSNIVEAFTEVYDSLIYQPNKLKFDAKLKHLNAFAHSSNLGEHFQNGIQFYNSQWDITVPFDIVITPSMKENGFTAGASFNNAMSELPLSFDDYSILFSVLMHEIYHILYDEQSAEFKWELKKWFDENPSKNNQYALLLLNESLATALGNGYVYERINLEIDSADWYNVKYINLMAKAIYPMLQEYLAYAKPIDKEFVDRYIHIYDTQFSQWTKELENLFTYRYFITNREEDNYYFKKNFPYVNSSHFESPITIGSFERMKEVPITKIIAVSSDHKMQLEMIKQQFPELSKWKFNSKLEFVHAIDLADNTKLFIVNMLQSDMNELMSKTFKNGIVE
jgi:hypothetical protein